MATFNPEKLKVSILPPTTKFMPLDGRKYTLTHSDMTGDLFLSIGTHYDLAKLNYKMRDEVLAEWVPQLGQYILSVKLYISGGEFDEHNAKVRFMIFQRELGTALRAIVYGDGTFINCFPWLLDSPIYVHYDSVYANFNQIHYFGTVRQFTAKID